MGAQSFFGAGACAKNVRSSIRSVILGPRVVNFGSANPVPNLCNWRAARGVSDVHKNNQVFVFTSEYVYIRQYFIKNRNSRFILSWDDCQWNKSTREIQHHYVLSSVVFKYVRMPLFSKIVITNLVWDILWLKSGLDVSSSHTLKVSYLAHRDMVIAGYEGNFTYM